MPVVVDFQPSPGGVGSDGPDEATQRTGSVVGEVRYGSADQANIQFVVMNMRGP